VERVYDHILRGVDGKKTVRVDSRGREIETIDMIPPYAGNNLRLTIDIDIQRAAERAFGDQAGAAGAARVRRQGGLRGFAAGTIHGTVFRGPRWR